MKFEFDKNASGDFSDEDYVTTLFTPYNVTNAYFYKIFNVHHHFNIFQSLLLQIESFSPDFLTTIDPDLPAIFGENSGLFMRVKIKDYLFDGIPICENGGVKGSFAAKFVCKQILSRVKDTKPMRLVNNTILFANFHFVRNLIRFNLITKACFNCL